MGENNNSTEKMQLQIDEINKKLDLVLTELSHQKKQRAEITDLKDDLMRVGTDVYNSSINELEEFSENLEMKDVVHLLKKLVRNVNNLTAAFEQMESARDFIADFSTITKDLFDSTMYKLEELENKGYFEFIARSQKITDKCVSSFSSLEIDNTIESIPTIIRLANKLTDPETMAALEKVLTVVDEINFDTTEKFSTFKLIKNANDPEVKKGIGILLRMFKGIVQA